MKELMFPSLLFALALCSTLFALRFLDMQFYHVSILEYVVPLHHLAFVHGSAPDPGVLQLFLEVFVNFLSKIFEFAVSRSTNGAEGSWAFPGARVKTLMISKRP